MRGTDHALFGLVAYGGALYVGHSQFAMDFPTPPTIILGGAVALGAGLAADIDEQHSVASQGAGIFGSLARVITGATGGHRTLTHYPLLWCGGLALLCLALINGHLGSTALGVTSGVFVALGFPFVVGPKRRSRLGPLLDVLTIGVAIGVAWTIIHFDVQPGWWLYAAIPVPYLAHMIGDTPTPQGVPWLFPFSTRKHGFGLFHSGGSFERVVVTPLLLVGCIALLYVLLSNGAFHGPWTLR